MGDCEYRKAFHLAEYLTWQAKCLIYALNKNAVLRCQGKLPIPAKATL